MEIIQIVSEGLGGVALGLLLGFLLLDFIILPTNCPDLGRGWHTSNFLLWLFRLTAEKLPQRENRGE